MCGTTYRGEPVAAQVNSLYEDLAEIKRLLHNISTKTQKIISEIPPKTKSNPAPLPFKHLCSNCEYSGLDCYTTIGLCVNSDKWRPDTNVAHPEQLAACMHEIWSKSK
jgi:hypothetical protein